MHNEVYWNSSHEDLHSTSADGKRNSCGARSCEKNCCVWPLQYSLWEEKGGGTTMTFSGHVKNGVVLLDHGATLPEGAEVRVELVDDAAQTEGVPTLHDTLAEFIGKAEGLPRDMSV